MAVFRESSRINATGYVGRLAQLHASTASRLAEAGLDLIGTIELLMAAKVDVRHQYPRSSGDHIVIVPAILLQFSQRDTRLFFIHIESWRKHLATLAEWRETAASRRRRKHKTSPHEGHHAPAH